MPLLGKGLGQGFLDRLRDRLKRELGRPGGDTGDEGGGGVEKIQPTFRERLIERVRQELGVPGAKPVEEAVVEPAPYAGPPTSLNDVMNRIQAAGSQEPPKLLLAKYNGQYRHLEPYSFRFRAKEDPHVPLFYAFCHKDNQIEAFKLQKFEDMQVTDIPFQPQWTVEF